MSGRITAIDVVMKDPDHIYIGSASGGVWESKNGGTEWDPIFDEQTSLAIGAIKINQQNPSEIWVAQGKEIHVILIIAVKEYSGHWMVEKHGPACGLIETKVIHRILIDPFNPSTIYAGASGSAWGPNPERGVFKSTDSGKTWNKVLYSNDRSGVADMIMDPTIHGRSLQALYEYGRTPWDYKGGGEGSGLYITYDGGETWKKKTSDDGLPKGNLGELDWPLLASRPEIIYALIRS
jgi:photosystem II stability/assembly factor-like uncharacterized protein